MCKFFSGIMKYKMKGIWWDLDLDSHTDIMDKHKVKDEKKHPSFVKFEMIPEDNDVFNHTRKNWRLYVDSDHTQDTLPDWWDRRRAEEMAWVHLQTVFAERFIIGSRDPRKLEIGRWYVKESSTVVAWGSSTVEAWESSTVVAWGSSTVEAWESSKVVARGSSTVELPCGRGNLKSIHEKAVARDGIKIIVSDKKYKIEYVGQ